MSFKNYLLRESGLTRVRRMLWGDVPTINSIGIMSAENPQGSPPSPESSPQDNAAENNRRTKRLYDYLRSANYGPIKIKGKFGQWENSFLIPNISRNELASLGKQFDQMSVIWGSRQEQNSNPFFRFEYIEGDKTTQSRDVHVGNDDISSREDLFSMVKGRKFIIPFFDDPYANYKPGAKRGTIEPPPAVIPQALRKAEFVVPLFDDLLVEVELINGHREPTYYSGMLKDNPHAMQLVAEVRQREANLRQANKAEKYYWAERGYLQMALEELAKLLD